MTGTLPLAGLTVVDLTQVLAGPFATMTLGDFGAEVIKIEAVGRGDRSRAIDPYPEYYDTVNRNKRSVSVDLKTADGQAVVQRLVQQADVFVESLKPGRADRFGLTYEDVSAGNPGLVYCSISGFGSGSPYAGVAAWDMLVQAMSGIMSMTGERDGPPLWSGFASGDLAAGLYAIQSILAALLARERGEIQGEWIEVPMLDAAISLLTVRAGHTFGTGEPFPRQGTRHPSIAPFGTFQCADGSIVIAAGTDSFFEDFCTVIDRRDLLDDPRFATISDRLEHREELLAAIEPIIEREPTAEWIERLHAQGIPAGPIYDTATVWEDEHVVQRGLQTTIDRENRPDATVIDHPVHFTEVMTSLNGAPEELGESTDSVLTEYGYSPAEIDALRADGIIG